MLNFEVLGRVTAWRDGWVADLTTKQQHLVAVLALAGGRPVARTRLEDILWGERGEPGTSLNRVAAEVRRQLRPAFDGPDPVPGDGAGYRLVTGEDQVDALRFRARTRAADQADGPQAAGLLRDALAEWGEPVGGLYGGEPLSGLPGQWADNIRAKLRAEYRDARLQCLRQQMREARFELTLDQCEQLADGPEALVDEPFVELWMLAAHHCGQRARAAQVFRRADKAAGLRLGVPATERLRQLDKMIREDSPRLRGDRAAPLPLLPVSDSMPSNVGKPMSENRAVFNNDGNVRIGIQAEHVEAQTIPITMPADHTPTDDTVDTPTAEDT